MKELRDLFEVVKLEDDAILENCQKFYYYLEVIDCDDKTSPSSGRPIVLNKKIVNVKFAMDNKIYSGDFETYQKVFQDIFEDASVLKIGYDQKQDYILLKQAGIEPKNMRYDVKIAAYLINSNTNQDKMNELALQYLQLDIDTVQKGDEKEEQTSLFDEPKEEKTDLKDEFYCYCISKLPPILDKKLEEISSLSLFQEIEMPLVEVLAEMQYEGM